MLKILCLYHFRKKILLTNYSLTINIPATPCNSVFDGYNTADRSGGAEE